MPAPSAPMPLMPLPMATSTPKITGQTNSRIAETTMETTPVTMATERLPEKKASTSGSLVPLNLL